ncbi:MAG: hypothetical protein FH747_13850 [Stenotrophomonas sp.]|uniref:PBECR2 nuclease fold domain-containing protein n=1 Tax=Stenotrophomonas sp. TaxID=69392 RepID=UPI00135379F6|nr:PBECR2 nuclease fold domain-containing protein [Stenotrophomonas sp.]MTI74718.1 hypothetical protein [Stenotrophomonas sp.]
MATASYGTVPFGEQIEFFRRKLNLPTNGWTDIYTQEHDWAFVVAGANRDEIVADFHTAVERAISEGRTLAEFRKDFDAIVAKHRWDYNGGRNWRSRVIYETNLRTSYAAGRYEQLQALKSVRPFWQYVHSDAVQHPRPLHLSWNNLVLLADDPWWITHFGPNGWGCQCTVRALNQRDLDRMGLKVGTAPPTKMETLVIGQRSPQGPRTVSVPEGIDPGFEYTPGRARFHSAMPPEIPDPPVPGSAGGPGVPNRRAPGALPAARVVGAARLLDAGLTEAEYATAFLSEFGATMDAPVLFQDVLGERIAIGADLFLDASERLKVTKRGRERYLRLLADAIKQPDEIWARVEWLFGAQKSVVRRRYVARFEIEGENGTTPMLAVFERGEDGWFGVTTFQGEALDDENWRIGVRLYRRGQQ